MLSYIDDYVSNRIQPPKRGAVSYNQDASLFTTFVSDCVCLCICMCLSAFHIFLQKVFELSFAKFPDDAYEDAAVEERIAPTTRAHTKSSSKGDSLSRANTTDGQGVRQAEINRLQKEYRLVSGGITAVIAGP